jgi:uncharacterized protein YigA (DUF484 family)
MVDLDRMTRRFLLGEDRKAPSGMAYIQSLGKALSELKVSSQRDRNIVEIAKSHLREIRKQHKKLHERVSILEEKLNILEEMSLAGAGAVDIAPMTTKKRNRKDDDK